MAMFGLIWLWQPAVNAGTPSLSARSRYLGLPPPGGDPRKAAAVMDGILQGKLNAVVEVTLAANAMSSIVTDARIGPNSWFWGMALTASAALEVSRKAMYVASRGKGTATIVHAADPATDRTFAMAILG